VKILDRWWRHGGCTSVGLVIVVGEPLEEWGWASDECGGHLESSWWDIFDGAFLIIQKILYEVGGATRADTEDLLIDFFGAHSAGEVVWDGDVNDSVGIAGGDHDWVVDELQGELRDGELAVLLAVERCEW
jgi:hypothetical protein